MKIATASEFRIGSERSPRGVALQEAAIWLLAFGVVFYLALRGGGYDSVLRNQVGIAVWWTVVAGVVVGALPVRRPSLLALVALGLFTALVLWTAAGLAWSESPERTSDDLGRAATYLGFFALALFLRGPRAARQFVTALGAAIALVALVALASRLHPAWFPDADQTAQFLPTTRGRLGYPLNFWNGLAAMVAMGLPLILRTAISAKSAAVRAMAAGVLPAMVLTIFFTFSRGGVLAACAGLAVFFAFSADRGRALMPALLAGAGGSVLIFAASRRDALESGLADATARHQGDELLVIAIGVCIAVGLLHIGMTRALRGRKPRFRVRLGRREARGVLALAAVFLLVTVSVVDLPGRASNAWAEFKRPDNPGGSADRLESLAGNGRYQQWGVALDENASKPLTGTGSGTFEFWWSRKGSIGGFVRDAHSLYFETLGEMGLVGLALLAAFLSVVLIGGAVKTVAAAKARRPYLAAALGGCAAFSAAATFDWVWELAAVSAAFLLLASALVGAGGSKWHSRVPPLAGRAAIATTALVAIIVIAIPLSATTSLRESQADARSGDLYAALDAARTAQRIRPYSASPWLQEALVWELSGDLGAAVAAARTATEREETNWRNWLTLSRLEAARGRVSRAIFAYRRARALNPRSILFAR